MQTAFGDDSLSIFVKKIHTERLGTDVTFAVRNASENYITILNLTFYFGQHVVQKDLEMELAPHSERPELWESISSQRGIDENMEAFRLGGRTPPPDSIYAAYDRVAELNRTISPELSPEELAAANLEVGVAVQYRVNGNETSLHKTSEIPLARLSARGY